MKKNPRDVKAVNNLGVVTLDNLKDPRAAIPHFDRAIALAPTFAEPHARKGDALAMTGQVDAAITSYRQALELEPALKKTGLPQRLARLVVQKALRGGRLTVPNPSRNP